jgi:hypothetical protein
LSYPEPTACGFTIQAKAIHRYVAGGPDADSDRIPDDDNCPDIANQKQYDANQDDIGDLCDDIHEYDYDLDSTMDTTDNCPERCNENQIDWDNDGLAPKRTSRTGEPERQAQRIQWSETERRRLADTLCDSPN